MGFKHTTVEEIEKRTHELVSNPRIETISAEDANRIASVDGIVVRKELAALCTELRKVYKHIKFGVARNCESCWVSSVLAAEELWAYMPNDIYAPVRIGYGDYRVRCVDTAVLTYGVYARNIENQKFKPDRRQYHMVLSEKLDKALSAVKSNLRMYRPEEIARMSSHDYAVEVRVASRQATNVYDEKRLDVLRNPSLHVMLRNLLNSEFEFHDVAFKQELEDMFKAEEEMYKEKSKVHLADFVLVRMEGDKQVFDVIRAINPKGWDVNQSQGIETYDESAVPEDIARKMAALSMLQPNNYIEGLGMRVGINTYWIAYD
jgi:hypothetical protein